MSKLPNKKNINNKTLKVCNRKRMTGFYRDGYCMTGQADLGTHTVCAKMDRKFLEYTKSRGNDLTSVVKPGEKWCLCENRWNEAFNDNIAPRVVRNATNKRVDRKILKNINKTRNKKRKTGHKQKGGKNTFLFNPKNPKKSFDVYVDKNPKDTIPIKYKTYKDVIDTIKKLERLYKRNKYTHKRIWQVGMILYVRLKVLKDKKKRHFKLAERYLNF